MSETVRSPTDDSKFEITSDVDDERVCAREGCSADPDGHLTVTASCDHRGSLIPWGEVAFCSLGCAKEFAQYNYWSVDEEDLCIYLNPVAVKVKYAESGGVIDVALGVNTKAALESAAEFAGELVSPFGDEIGTPDGVTPDDLSFETVQL